MPLFATTPPKSGVTVSAGGAVRTRRTCCGALPIIWDADFLYGPRSDSGEDTYVLCEINVSSVIPLPDQAATEIARLVRERLMQ